MNCLGRADDKAWPSGRRGAAGRAACWSPNWRSCCCAAGAAQAVASARFKRRAGTSRLPNHRSLRIWPPPSCPRLKSLDFPTRPLTGSLRVPVELAAPTDSFKAEGACGGAITEPSIHTGAIERLANPKSWIAIWVTHPLGQEARRSLAASIADARPGCPDHNATNPDGSTEQIHFAGTLPLPGIGDQSLAAHFRVTALGQTNDSWVVLIRRGEYLTAITTGAQQPFSPTFIRALAATADRHLSAIAG